MKTTQPMKICLVASAGGHLTQLRKVAKAWAGYSTFWITSTDVVRNALNGDGQVYVVGECNREHLGQVVLVFFRCLRAILKEKPSVVISTGAAPGCIAVFLCKLRGAKVVWLDSITNVEHLSLSGRMVRPFADLFLVQWPELAAKYRHVEYVGEVI
jgi:UDP-N-acetylglucosamine:LPS N-acetylglucosamine transferase